MATKWRLPELMARHGVKGFELAHELGIKEDQVSRLRLHPPGMTLGRFDEIAAALTLRSKRGEVVRGIDLIEDDGEPNA